MFDVIIYFYVCSFSVNYAWTVMFDRFMLRLLKDFIICPSVSNDSLIFDYLTQ